MQKLLLIREKTSSLKIFAFICFIKMLTRNNLKIAMFIFSFVCVTIVLQTASINLIYRLDADSVHRAVAGSVKCNIGRGPDVRNKFSEVKAGNIKQRIFVE